MIQIYSNVKDEKNIQKIMNRRKLQSEKLKYLFVLGCGKSEVIICIILQMWCLYLKNRAQDQRHPQVLLCAPSNAAIDDIFQRLVRVRERMSKSLLILNCLNCCYENLIFSKIRKLQESK